MAYRVIKGDISNGANQAAFEAAVNLFPPAQWHGGIEVEGTTAYQAVDDGIPPIPPPLPPLPTPQAPNAI